MKLNSINKFMELKNIIIGSKANYREKTEIIKYMLRHHYNRKMKAFPNVIRMVQMRDLF